VQWALTKVQPLRMLDTSEDKGNGGIFLLKAKQPRCKVTLSRNDMFYTENPFGGNIAGAKQKKKRKKEGLRRTRGV
jgi:hypothetical protein